MKPSGSSSTTSASFKKISGTWQTNWTSLKRMDHFSEIKALNTTSRRCSIPNGSSSLPASRIRSKWRRRNGVLRRKLRSRRMNIKYLIRCSLTSGVHFNGKQLAYAKYRVISNWEWQTVYSKIARWPNGCSANLWHRLDLICRGESSSIRVNLFRKAWSLLKLQQEEPN